VCVRACVCVCGRVWMMGAVSAVGAVGAVGTVGVVSVRDHIQTHRSWPRNLAEDHTKAAITKGVERIRW
jgi:hypothetical protein